ncbi:MAG: hypothetical protein ABIE84_04090 [bacterium]
MKFDSFNDNDKYSFDKPAKRKSKYGAGGAAMDNYQRYLEFLEKSSYSDETRRRIVTVNSSKIVKDQI